MRRPQKFQIELEGLEFPLQFQIGASWCVRVKVENIFLNVAWI